MGDSGQAGYIGHIKITQEETAICSCGSTGCVEVLASAKAIVRHYNRLENASLDPDGSGFETVRNKANNSDVAAREAFRLGGYWLGIGLGDAMNVLNPSTVTIGGGVLEASSTLGASQDDDPYLNGVLEGAARAAHRRVFASAHLCRAEFGNDGGLIGAALLAAE